MRMAINAAEQFLGATAPNPPVGAIALDKNGEVLLGAGHQGAGFPHAEAKVLDLAAKLGKIKEIYTLVITLEPCNHQGRTPACTEGILKHKNIRRVVFGCKDPNPKVKGGGAARLKDAGIEVIEGVLEQECKFLARGFFQLSQHKKPWVILKQAIDEKGSMLPPPGQKTFTSSASLFYAHELRKKSDAIWTGSGTILADDPEFTVRLLPDHPGKKRHLLISDRRRRVPEAWLKKATANGFLPFFPSTFEEGLNYLGEKGALQVLVEAGPELHNAWQMSGLWNESVVIKKDKEDSIDIQFHEEET